MSPGVTVTRSANPAARALAAARSSVSGRHPHQVTRAPCGRAISIVLATRAANVKHLGCSVICAAAAAPAWIARPPGWDHPFARMTAMNLYGSRIGPLFCGVPAAWLPSPASGGRR